MFSPVHPLPLPRPPPPIPLPLPSSVSPPSCVALILFLNKTLSPRLSPVHSPPSLPIFSPMLLFNCIHQISFFFTLPMPGCCYANLSHPFSPCSIPLSPYSPNPAFPRGVNWRCDGMMSEQRSSVGVNDCQLGQTHCRMSEKEMRFPCGHFFFPFASVYSIFARAPRSLYEMSYFPMSVSVVS